MLELSWVDLVAHSSLPGLGSPRQKHKFPPYVPGSPALFHQFLGGGAMLSKFYVGNFQTTGENYLVTNDDLVKKMNDTF